MRTRGGCSRNWARMDSAVLRVLILAQVGSPLSSRRVEGRWAGAGGCLGEACQGEGRRGGGDIRCHYESQEKCIPCEQYLISWERGFQRLSHMPRGASLPSLS
jgi:hypothetical protein